MVNSVCGCYENVRPAKTKFSLLDVYGIRVQDVGDDSEIDPFPKMHLLFV